jgi:hypothetical protein
VNELVTGVRISLEIMPVEACIALDSDSSGTAEINEIIDAIRHALEGCPTEEEALFLIRACSSPENPDGETFRALIRDPTVIATAESLVGAGQQQILNGALVAGDGGFNAPWSWHLDPETVGFTDLAIELCDGCPLFIEEDLEYWLDVVGRYCPWSTEVVARER